jgi:hypothetical protein
MKKTRVDLRQNQTHFRLVHSDESRRETLEIIDRKSKLYLYFKISINMKEEINSNKNITVPD